MEKSWLCHKEGMTEARIGDRADMGRGSAAPLREFERCLRGFQVAADQGGVYEITEADGEGQDAEATGDHGFRLTGEPGYQREHDDETQATADQQNSCAARTCKLRKLRLH